MILAQALDPATAYRMRDLKALLDERGEPVNFNTILKDLKALGWRLHGRAQASRWMHVGRFGTPQDSTPGRKRKAPTKAQIKANRTATANILRKLGKRKEPVPALFFRKVRVPVAVLIRHGYVKRSGDGFERTDKPFSI